MKSGVVAELWRYPASSLGGEAMQTLPVDMHGAFGDRLYGLIDRASGEIARPDADKKWHPVPRIKARLTSSRMLEIATPDSTWLSAPSAEVDRAISAFLGFEAGILPYEVVAGPTEQKTEARYTKAPIHLLTTASLARLKALHPDGNPDSRRFRPNILVDMPEVEGIFPETEWIGRRLAIGDLEVTVVEPCRRCGFTILAQDCFDFDPNILRNLVRHNDRNIGVYCTVDRPATVALAEPMRFLR